jgi:hypothetical protein
VSSDRSLSLLLLFFPYIPRPWILGHGWGDTIIVWWEMEVPHHFSLSTGHWGWYCIWQVSLRAPGSGHAGRRVGMWLGRLSAPSRLATSILLDDRSLCPFDVRHAWRLWSPLPSGPLAKSSQKVSLSRHVDPSRSRCSRSLCPADIPVLCPVGLLPSCLGGNNVVSTNVSNSMGTLLPKTPLVAPKPLCG